MKAKHEATQFELLPLQMNVTLKFKGETAGLWHRFYEKYGKTVDASNSQIARVLIERALLAAEKEKAI
jgi:RecB family exonuclease